MAFNLNQVIISIIAILAPFTPFLADMGKVGGKKLAEVIGEKGGETAWRKAQVLWNKLKTHFNDDSEVQSALTLMAAKPEDQNRQIILAETLRERLKNNPTLAQELFDLLGRQESVQQVLANNISLVENISQHMRGSGKQIIKADESTIKNIRQVKE